MQFAGTISTGAGYSESRRKRRLIISISTRRSVYEWTAISFLLALPLIGMGILGAVRLWISGPLLVLCFLGVALFFLRPLLTGDRQTLKIPPGGIAWVVFLLYGLALIPLSRVPYDARIEMLYVASYVGAYWAWTELTSCYRRWRIILSLVIVAVTVIAWYAIIQNANESRMVLGWERPEAYGMRASGTFFCPNHFAHLLSVSICICVALAMMAASGAALRLLAIYGIALCISALFLTQSRSGWIGAVVGVGVTVSMAMWRKSQKWFLATILGGPIVLLLVSAALWMGSDVFRDRLITAMPGASGSTAAIRLNIWHDTLPMIQDAPVLGHGPGSYRWVYPAYRSFSAQLWARYAHNEYLHMLSEFGIVGFLLAAVAVAAFAMKLLSVFRKASRDRDALMIAGLMGAVAASLTHALFDYNLHIPSTMHLLVMFAGITVGGIFSSEDLPVVQLKRNASNVLWVVGTAAALAFAFLSAHAYIVDNLVQRGETRRKNVQLQEAQEYFASARHIDPSSWEARLKLAHVLRTRAFWELDPEHKKELAKRAQDEFQAVSRLNPGQMEALHGLSQVYEMLGDQDQALAFMSRATEYDQMNAYYWNQLALYNRRQGRLEEALEQFRKALSLDTPNETARLNIRSLEKRLRK